MPIIFNELTQATYATSAANSIENLIINSTTFERFMQNIEARGTIIEVLIISDPGVNPSASRKSGESNTYLIEIPLETFSEGSSYEGLERMATTQFISSKSRENLSFSLEQNFFY